MLKKLLLAGIFALVFSAVSFADDFVAMTINFYADGDITPDGEFPAGVVMLPKSRFSNKNLPGHAYCVDINLEKAQEVEQTFTVKGAGRLVVSVNPRRVIGGQRQKEAPRVKCVKMVVNGKSYKTPYVFNKWRYGAPQITVKDGDTLTIKAVFKKVE